MLNNVLQKNIQPITSVNVVRTEVVQRDYDEIRATVKKYKDILQKRAETKANSESALNVDTNLIIIETPPTRKYTDHKLIPNIQKLALVDGKDKNGMVSEATLLERMNDDIFLESFRKSLLLSYQYKKNIYAQKYNDTKLISDRKSERSTEKFLIFDRIT